MHVLVTGGAGFIGATLVRVLTRREAVTQITVLDDLSTGFRENLSGVEGVRFVEGSILDRDALDGAAESASAIVHLAALPSVPRSIADPLATHHANATGTVEVLEAARRAGGAHVVVASSSSVYGANPALPKHEELMAAPLSPYGVSKLAAESYALAYRACFGLPALVFRFFNVFGPLQPAGHAYAAAIPTFVAAALAGLPITVHGDGLQSRDFTYVGSVAEVLADAVVRRLDHPGPVNLAFGTRRTLLEVVTAIEQVLGRPLTVEHHEPRQGDVRHSQSDQRRFRQLFPDVRPVDFSVALRETIDWYKNQIK
jgi:UDP-glucose 4-epimerase